MEMSAKGLASPMFSNPMETNTAAAYVLCGLVAIVLWSVSKYLVKSSHSKKLAPRRAEQNGGAVAGVSSTDAPDVGGAEEVKTNCLGNGIAGGTKSERANGPDDFIELRSSAIEVFELNGSVQGITPGHNLAKVGGSEWRVAQKTGWKEEGPHVVHLLENGWTEEDLDMLQCPIEVYAWYELAAILLDGKRRRVAEFQHCPESSKQATDVFKRVSLIFENYGAGVRYVTYSHRRRKSMDKECKEHCGSEMYSGLRKLLQINNLK